MKHCDGQGGGGRGRSLGRGATEDKAGERRRGRNLGT